MNILLIMAATFSTIIAVLVATLIAGSFIDAAPAVFDTYALEQAESALLIFDFGIVFLNVGMYLAAILLASRIRTNPVFALPSVLVLTISVWVSSELANIYALFGNTDPLQPVVEQFPTASLFVENFPLVTLGLGGLFIVVLFSKSVTGGQPATAGGVRR